MYPLTLLLGIASARNDIAILPYVSPLLLVGGGFSVYHVLIQEMPHRSSSPFCGPASCVEDVLNAFGFITVPMLALTAFALIGVCLLLAKRVKS